MRLFANLSITTKILSLTGLMVLLGSVGLAASSFAAMTSAAQAGATAPTLYSDVSLAYEQWTLDDDQNIRWDWISEN